MTTPTEAQPRRWEYAASALVTAGATLAAILSADTTELAALVKRLDAAPTWLRAIVSVPEAVWWGVLVVVAALLYWLGARLARRWGTVALLLAPAAMLALKYLIPWLLYAPIRAALPSSGL